MPLEINALWDQGLSDLCPMGSIYYACGINAPGINTTGSKNGPEIQPPGTNRPGIKINPLGIKAPRDQCM